MFCKGRTQNNKKNMKKIYSLGIIFVIILVLIVSLSPPKNKVSVQKFSNSPCYYYSGNKTVSLFGINSSQVKFYQNPVSKVFFFKSSNGTEVDECVPINFTKSEICGTDECLTLKWIKENGQCQTSKCDSYKINDFLIILK